jgi:hypothetical protein
MVRSPDLAEHPVVVTGVHRIRHDRANALTALIARGFAKLSLFCPVI